MQTGEQVIKGLEEVLANEDLVMQVSEDAVEAAIALLKKQQPRIMARNEILKASRIPVWLDVKSKHKDLYSGWVLAYEVKKGMGITGERLGMADPSGRMHWCKLDDYGRTWRVWNTVPTNAQREAIPWQG